MVRSGVYQEDKLEITKQLTIISQIPNQAVINIHPSMYPTDFYGITIMMLNDSIDIHADNVELYGLVIKNQKPDFAYDESTALNNYGSIFANGSGIQITNNIFGDKGMPIKLKLNGNNNQATGNSITAIDVNGNSNKISNNIGAIHLSGSNNKILENTGGQLLLANASNNIVTSNSFNKQYGSGIIRLVDADYNTFRNNTVVTDYTVAVEFGSQGTKGGSHNLFTNNTIEGATLWGVLLGLGDYNVFYGNIIANNGGLKYSGYGLAMGGNHRQVNNNLFYGNIFMNNNKNFGANWEVVGSGNSFDNGSMGNYWDDYLAKYPNAVEIGNSGVGSVPYQIYGNVADNYPLMKISGVKTDAEITVPAGSTKSYPTPTMSEVTAIVIMPLLLLLFSVALVLRYRKTVKLKQ
ncbi:MAG: right-handed parallel beta-helix repeat-containing protein [Candidatus Bathyarchaeia archaeon]